MINKYWLYKQVLEKQSCTSNLKPEESTQFDIFDFPKPTMEELYSQRIEQIDYHMLSCIDVISVLTGHETKSLMRQRDHILNSLKGQWENVKAMLDFGYSFKEVLERRFGITLNNIYDYEKAEKLLTGNREVTVILDNNRTKLTMNGKTVMVHTIAKNNNVPIEKLREIAQTLHDRKCYPNELEVNLSVYTQTAGNELGDEPEECLTDKKVIYNVKEDKMVVYENGKEV